MTVPFMLSDPSDVNKYVCVQGISIIISVIILTYDEIRNFMQMEREIFFFFLMSTNYFERHHVGHLSHHVLLFCQSLFQMWCKCLYYSYSSFLLASKLFSSFCQHAATQPRDPKGLSS